jgi:hypothetical protein
MTSVSIYIFFIIFINTFYVVQSELHFSLMLEFMFYSSVGSINKCDSVRAYVTGCAKNGGLMIAW